MLRYSNFAALAAAAVLLASAGRISATPLPLAPDVARGGIYTPKSKIEVAYRDVAQSVNRAGSNPVVARFAFSTKAGVGAVNVDDLEGIRSVVCNKNGVVDIEVEDAGKAKIARTAWNVGTVLMVSDNTQFHVVKNAPTVKEGHISVKAERSLKPTTFMSTFDFDLGDEQDYATTGNYTYDFSPVPLDSDFKGIQKSSKGDDGVLDCKDCRTRGALKTGFRITGTPDGLTKFDFNMSGTLLAVFDALFKLTDGKIDQAYNFDYPIYDKTFQKFSIPGVIDVAPKFHLALKTYIRGLATDLWRSVGAEITIDRIEMNVDVLTRKVKLTNWQPVVKMLPSTEKELDVSPSQQQKQRSFHSNLDLHVLPEISLGINLLNVFAFDVAFQVDTYLLSSLDLIWDPVANTTVSEGAPPAKRSTVAIAPATSRSGKRPTLPIDGGLKDVPYLAPILETKCDKRDSPLPEVELSVWIGVDAVLNIQSEPVKLAGMQRQVLNKFCI